MRLQHSRRARRHVLEFVSDDIDGCGEGGERRFVVEIGRCVRAAQTSKAGSSATGEKTCDLRPSRARRHRQHARRAGRRPECRSSRRARASAVRPVARRQRHAFGLARAIGGEPRGERLVGARENGGGEQRGVDRARLADGERSDRHAARHLHDGEKRIHALQRIRFDRHAENGQGGHGGGHARQMRRAAGAGDDDLESFRLRALGEGHEPVRRAMGGYDARVAGDIERGERLDRVAHGRPVGLRPHDDGDRRIGLRHSCFLEKGKPCGIDDASPIGKRANRGARAPISLRAPPLLALRSFCGFFNWRRARHGREPKASGRRARGRDVGRDRRATGEAPLHGRTRRGRRGRRADETGFRAASHA